MYCSFFLRDVSYKQFSIICHAEEAELSEVIVKWVLLGVLWAHVRQILVENVQFEQLAANALQVSHRDGQNQLLVEGLAVFLACDHVDQLDLG